LGVSQEGVAGDILVEDVEIVNILAYWSRAISYNVPFLAYVRTTIKDA
jgi:hypothetical protein